LSRIIFTYFKSLDLQGVGLGRDTAVAGKGGYVRLQGIVGKGLKANWPTFTIDQSIFLMPPLLMAVPVLQLL
jgi:hypothetical protein